MAEKRIKKSHIDLPPKNARRYKFGTTLKECVELKYNEPIPQKEYDGIFGGIGRED